LGSAVSQEGQEAPTAPGASFSTSLRATVTTGHRGRWVTLPASKEHASKYGDQIAPVPLPSPIPVDGAAIWLDRNDPKRSAEMLGVLGSIA